jgi:acetolactate synthase-1/2/3 large subunit
MAASEQVAVLPRAMVPVPPPPGQRDVEAAAGLIAAGRYPMIKTGGGAQGASAEVLALAELLVAPVAAFRGGRGVVAEDHKLGVSSYAARLMWPEADVLIGIGTRLEMPYMRWSGMMRLIDRPDPPPHLVRIDIDPAEMNRLVPHAGIVADAAVGARALTKVLRAQGFSSDGAAKRRERIANAKAKARAAINGVQPQLAYLDVIREALPRDGFLVPELSQAGFTTYFGFDVLEPRTYVSEGFQGTLGFGFPTALGVKAANPDRAVVSIAGDGGFMFGVQELATAVQFNIGVVTLVFNNNAYGNVRRDQRERFEGRVVASDLVNPDFVKLAESFGVAAARVTSPDYFRAALEKALAHGGPYLIDIEVPRDSEVTPWTFIHPAKP